MLIEKIQADSLEARKAGETEQARLLVTLYAEAVRVGKDDGNRATTDEEVQTVIRKFLKNIRDTLTVLPADRAEARRVAEWEKTVLEAYLPRQAGETELRAYIAEVVATLPVKSSKQMGTVMGALKQKFDGNYDGSLASTLVKAALA